MSGEPPVVQLSTVATVISVLALVGAFLAVAYIHPTIAIILIIFGFVFGEDILRQVSVRIDSEQQTEAASETDNDGRTPWRCSETGTPAAS